MSNRTLEDALERAKSLRNFKVANYERFERCPDFEDLVALADEVERLRIGIKMGTQVIMDRIVEDDHDESW